MVVIVDVSEKVIILGENIRTAHVDCRQTNSFWIFNRINVAIFIRQASAGFIAQVQARILIANDLRWVFYVNGAVIGCNDQPETELLRLLDYFKQR